MFLHYYIDKAKLPKRTKNFLTRINNRAFIAGEWTLEEEKRNSERIPFEIPVTFDIGRNTFFGTTSNLADDGMMIESSLAQANIRKILKTLLKADECQVEVNYSVKGRLFSRPGKIRHYHLDFLGSTSACRFSFGVWIPKLKMRYERGL
jgi:hypothetical protein